MHCRELGYEDKDIVVDVVLSGNPHLNHVLAKVYNSLSVAERTFEIMQYYERMFGLLRAKQGHTDVDFRYIIGARRQMANKIVPEQFTKDEVESQIT